MYPIQPLQYQHDLIVFCGPHILAHEKSVLDRGSPGDAGGRAGGDLREGLVLAEEGEQGEVVVG